jgi:hypothetical protein
VTAPRLTTGDAHFDLLGAAEEPRHYERAVLLETHPAALSFLERIHLTDPARELLASSLGAGRSFAASRMSDGEMRSAVALRIARGELRLVEVRRAALPFVFRGTPLRVLRGSERPRAGESAHWFVDRDTAHRFLQQLHDDPWSRRGIEDAARHATGAPAGDDARSVLRAFAGQLASGRARIVRLSTAPSALPAPTAALTRIAVVERAPPLADPPFQLCQIPDVMEHTLCWPTAAALMRRWFSHGAYTMTRIEKEGEADPSILPPKQIDSSIVKLQWALGFPRPLSAYEDSLRGGWNTSRGRELLARRIQVARVRARIQTEVWRFGDLTLPASVLDKTCQTNVVHLESDMVNEDCDFRHRQSTFTAPLSDRRGPDRIVSTGYLRFPGRLVHTVAAARLLEHCGGHTRKVTREPLERSQDGSALHGRACRRRRSAAQRSTTRSCAGLHPDAGKCGNSASRDLSGAEQALQGVS